VPVYFINTIPDTMSPAASKRMGVVPRLGPRSGR
jgi:hypothetical protein